MRGALVAEVQGQIEAHCIAPTHCDRWPGDEDQLAGVIDDQLRVKMQTARFPIAELTEENRGAYWEAGFAEAAGKPVSYTCEKGHISEVHFDANHHLIVEWEEENLELAKTKLKATIRASFPADAKLDGE